MIKLRSYIFVIVDNPAFSDCTIIEHNIDRVVWEMTSDRLEREVNYVLKDDHSRAARKFHVIDGRHDPAAVSNLNLSA